MDKQQHATRIFSLLLGTILLTLVLSANVSAQVSQDVKMGSMILTSYFQENMHSSHVHLYDFITGLPELIWSKTFPGIVGGVTLLDWEDDGSPEIIISTTPDQISWYDNEKKEWLRRMEGKWSLLLYRKISGTYYLEANKTISKGILPYENPRTREMDYYEDGTRTLINVLGKRFVLFHQRPGNPIVVETLTEFVGNHAFDVGDVTGDGRDDIVYHYDQRLRVLENQGNGQFKKTNNPGPRLWPFNQIRVGDLDSDGVDEIAIVGQSLFKRPLYVYKNIQGQYKSIWSYNSECPTTEIYSVDIGDIDGDGVDEMVTTCVGCRDVDGSRIGTGIKGGVTIWKFDKSEGEFYQRWVDRNSTALGMKTPLSLKVGATDSRGENRVFGTGNGKLYLGVINHNEQYESMYFDLQIKASLMNPFDIALIKRVKEPNIIFVLVFLVSCALLKKKINRIPRKRRPFFSFFVPIYHY